MTTTEFRRHMPEASDSLRRRRSLWSYTNLDPIMLLLLLALSAFGLFILYSASGQDMGYVTRQAIRMGAGFVAMVVLAQLQPRFFGR